MFDEVDLLILRDELCQSGLDTFQCAELIAAFLAQRGFGVSPNGALTAAVRTEPLGFPLTKLDRELARIARVM